MYFLFIPNVSIVSAGIKCSLSQSTGKGGAHGGNENIVNGSSVLPRQPYTCK